MFPAASYARIVTVFDPTNSGTAADHCPVPVAVPDPPVFVDQVTFDTSTLSEAVPETVRVAELVERLLPPGDEMVNAGAVVSEPPPGVGVGFGGGAGAGAGGGGVGVGTGVPVPCAA
jgi:hypothetical protein